MILLEVQGLSMAPGLRPGDVVLVDPASSLESARVGDVVVFRNTETREAFVHRLVRAFPVQVKGDRNSVLDPLTPAWNYEGIARQFHRNGRWRSLRAGRMWAWLSRNGLFPGQKIPVWLSRTKIRELLSP